MRNFRRPVLFAAILLSVCASAHNAYAIKAVASDACATNSTGSCRSTIANLKIYLDIHRRGGGGNESFLFGTFWKDTVNPGLQKLLSKIVQNDVKQTTAQGTFADAQNNNRALSALQQAAAGAALNYTPSEALCRFGTLSQSLAADDINSRTAQTVIARGGLKRDIGTTGTASEAGNAEDVKMRMEEYIMETCAKNPEDLTMCGSNPQRRFPNVARDTRTNADVNYTRTIEDSPTIEANYVTSGTSGEMTPAEHSVRLMEYNLYGSKLISGRPTEKEMKTPQGQNKFLMNRSVSAARSVAQNSYAAIAGMKSQGTGKNVEYLGALFSQLGVDPEKAGSALSKNPSYYAQMEVLTKKLYQDPTFYVNLMEGNTNVARQSAAMEGVELMQDRDIYNSMRRSEMLLALLVQLQARKKLDDITEER